MKSNSLKLCLPNAFRVGQNVLWRIGSFTFLIALMTLQGCKKHDPAPQPPTTPGLQLVADNLVSPLGVFDPDDGSKRLFILDQIGKIWTISKDGTRSANPFFDISSKMVTLSPGYDERGLLGF